MFMIMIGPTRMQTTKNKLFHCEKFVDKLLSISVMAMQSRRISTYFSV